MLKNKLFCSMVVFAAAAIFAVTFVACDSSTTENVYGGHTDGEPVEFVPIGASAGTAASVWALSNGSGYKSNPTTGFYTEGGSKLGFETAVATDTITRTEDSFADGAIYEVEVWTQSTKKLATFYYIATSTKILAAKPALNVGDMFKIIGKVADADSLAAGAAAGSAITVPTIAGYTAADEIFEVTVYDVATTGKKLTYYMAAASATTLTSQPTTESMKVVKTPTLELLNVNMVAGAASAGITGCVGEGIGSTANIYAVTVYNRPPRELR